MSKHVHGIKIRRGGDEITWIKKITSFVTLTLHMCSLSTSCPSKKTSNNEEIRYFLNFEFWREQLICCPFSQVYAYKYANIIFKSKLLCRTMVKRVFFHNSHCACRKSWIFSISMLSTKKMYHLSPRLHKSKHIDKLLYKIGKKLNVDI